VHLCNQRALSYHILKALQVTSDKIEVNRQPGQPHTQSTTSMGYGDQEQISIRCELWYFIRCGAKMKEMVFGSRFNALAFTKSFRYKLWVNGQPGR